MATSPIEPPPHHTPFASEVPAQVVERLTNEGTLMVKDATSDELRQMRLGVADVGAC
jgi:hypothetical protein